jgi:hypothetical protein
MKVDSIYLLKLWSTFDWGQTNWTNEYVLLINWVPSLGKLQVSPKKTLNLNPCALLGPT